MALLPLLRKYVFQTAFWQSDVILGSKISKAFVFFCFTLYVCWLVFVAAEEEEEGGGFLCDFCFVLAFVLVLLSSLEECCTINGSFTHNLDAPYKQP